MVGYLKGYCSEMAGVWLYGRRRNKDLLLEHGDSSSLGRWVMVGGFRGSKLHAECCAHSLPVLFNFLEIWGRQRPSIFQIKHLLKCIYLPFNRFYLLACSFKIFRISLGVEGSEMQMQTLDTCRLPLYWPTEYKSKFSHADICSSSFHIQLYSLNFCAYKSEQKNIHF